MLECARAHSLNFSSFLFSLTPQFLFHGFKYHLHDYDIYIYIFCLDLFPELNIQKHPSIPHTRCLLDIPWGCPADITHLTFPKWICWYSPSTKSTLTAVFCIFINRKLTDLHFLCKILVLSLPPLILWHSAYDLSKMLLILSSNIYSNVIQFLTTPITTPESLVWIKVRTQLIFLLLLLVLLAYFKVGR